MNRTIHKNEWLESIGGITPEVALRESFGMIHKDDVVMFHGKTILDIGAGFSDLLQYISEHAEPRGMIAVDPIYWWQEAQATTFTLNSIQNFIDLILSDPDCNRDEFLLQMRMNAERQKQVILQYPHQSIAIERYRDVPYSIDADYVFAINVLYAIDDPRSLLDTMDLELSTHWEIVIIDYSDRGNRMNKKIENTGIEIKKFEQYFVAKLRKWEIRKIDWKK